MPTHESESHLGALFYCASMVVNNGTNLDQHEIYVIDGQNIIQIELYHESNNTNNWNPCIPIPFDALKSVTITFDEQITSINDWYPSTIHCQTTIDYNN